MKHIEKRTVSRSFMIAMLGLLAACGTGSDDSASPSSLPFEETTTSVADVPATSASTPEETEATEPQLTTEMFENMLGTEAGRSLLISSMAAEIGIEPDAAECLLDAIPVETLVEAAGSFLGGASDGGFFAADQTADIAPLLESCGIAADVVLR